MTAGELAQAGRGVALAGVALFIQYSFAVAVGRGLWTITTKMMGG